MKPSRRSPKAPSRDQKIRDLTQRISVAEAGLETLLSGQVDAVIDPATSTPYLLRHAQVALQESETRYRRVMAQMPAIICELTADGRVMFVNDAVQRLTGFSAAELDGRNLWEVLTTREQRAAVQDLQRRVQREDVSRHEIHLTSKDGRVLTLEASSANRYSAESKLLNIVLLAVDITDRKAAEAALHELSGRILNLQDEERRRLARELHDSTAQTLAGLSMNLSILAEAVGMLDERQRAALQESQNSCADAMQDIRTMSYLLHPPLLDESGLLSALNWFVDGFSQRSGIKVKVQADSKMKRLPREVEMTLFRIVQEALTNVHRHSKSRSARIQMSLQNGHVNLEIADNGQGMPPEIVERVAGSNGGLGLGLAGMRERVRQLRGELQIHSTSRGATVRVTLPVTAAASVAAYAD